jgi:hypothetical protein
VFCNKKVVNNDLPFELQGSLPKFNMMNYEMKIYVMETESDETFL